MSYFVVLAASLLATSALAASSNPDRPYAGMETRELKALSPEQIDGLLQGKGMSLALAAELNGLPGPRHVLDLADKLALSEEQKARIADIFARMEREAKALGAEIVGLEARLEAAFASGNASAGEVAALTAEIGALQGRLRAVHLVTHLETTPILTQHQKRLYAVERGYAGDKGGHQPDAQGGHKH